MAQLLQKESVRGFFEMEMIVQIRKGLQDEDGGDGPAELELKSHNMKVKPRAPKASF